MKRPDCPVPGAAPLAWLLLVLFFAAALPALPAHANTPIALWKSFNGRVNFTGTQVTLRTGSNTDTIGNNGKGNDKDKTSPCTVTAADTTRSATLALPANATVVSAQLYWAGSGISDSTVTFQGNSVTASRKYTSSTVGGGYNYFGGAVDVTDVVKAKGGGTYSFSGLTVATGAPWCASQAVLGGFSLLVVYSHATQPERVLNIYEGFQFVQNSEVIVNASNFRWNRTAIPVEERARVGHISWEGDPTLASTGERLTFEGTELSDTLNPSGNQFNSRSNINNDSASYGIDFDAYDTKVVLWDGYDAVVTTSFRTGQDLVLLNAEILLVPTMPVSDLSIALTRRSELQVGMNALYTVTVTNNGPYTEAGPVTVTNTLPAGMTYVSGSGTGWTCSASGANGTCTYKPAIAPGASAAPLTVTAAVNTTGEKTNTVTVKGTDDDNPANNSASDTAIATHRDVSTDPTPATLDPYIFTEGVCTAGIAIGAPGQGCKLYSASTVGGQAAPIHITATSMGIPGAPSATLDTTPSMQFAIECVNPVAGKVGASFAGTGIPMCAEAGKPLAWSGAVTVKFPAKTVSVPQNFLYNDVGQVKLHLKESGSTAATEAFVSAPLQIGFKAIRHGPVPNPGNTAPGSTGFAPAGAPLTIEVGALLAGTAGYAPNFGNEQALPAIALGIAATPGVDLRSPGTFFESGTRAWKEGIMTTQAAWSEAGAVDFVAGLGEAGTNTLYLGVPVNGHRVSVGRFYPAYFKTIVTGPSDCPASLPASVSCPRGERGAVYSQQPFDITVEAYNANNELLKNFTGDWFRKITLSAVNSAGGTALPLNLVPNDGATSVSIAEASADIVRTTAPYALALGFRNNEPRATNLTPPTAVFVRATASETNQSGPTSISSLRTGEVSDEGGVLVLNGRLKVPNALGTDVLRTPLGLRAEYWAGAAGGWLATPEYADPAGAPGNDTLFLVCSQKFATSGNACDTTVVGASSPQQVRIAKGAGTLWLRAPGKLPSGASRTGSITLRFNGWKWLPSTMGRVTFGSHRSPVIYVREIYF